MKQNTKNFLLELAALLDKYKVEIEITESCSGWNGGFSAEGIEFDIPWIEEGGYPRNDWVELSGKYHNSADIFDYVEKHINEA